MADSREYNILNCKVNYCSRRFRCRATYILNGRKPIVKLCFVNGEDGVIASDETYVFNGENKGGEYSDRECLRFELIGIQRDFIERRLNVDEFKGEFDNIMGRNFWNKAIVVI